METANNLIIVQFRAEHIFIIIRRPIFRRYDCLLLISVQFHSSVLIFAHCHFVFQLFLTHLTHYNSISSSFAQYCSILLSLIHPHSISLIFTHSHSVHSVSLNFTSTTSVIIFKLVIIKIHGYSPKAMFTKLPKLLFFGN